jgi:hypothetical protein
MLLSPTLARAGAPPRVVTTQRATVSAQAFAADDPVMKDPVAAKALSPTMVSATFTATPAMRAFEELAKQSGYKIEPYDKNQARYGNVTATINNQPFWSAMREVCTRANVSVYYYGDAEGDRIALMPTNYGNSGMIKAAASIKGPFMTVVENLERVNIVNMSDPDKVDRSIRIQLQTFAEPKVIPTQHAYRPTIEEAVDENGNSMMPTDQQDQGTQSDRRIAFYGYIQLPYPTSNPGKRIAKVRGHIDAKIRLGSEAVEIDNPLGAKDVTRTVNGTKVTFKQMTREDDGRYKIELVYVRPADADAGPWQQEIYQTQPPMELIDPKQGRYQSYSSGGHGNQDEITREFSFQRRNNEPGAAKPPEPTKLIIKLATATQDVAIPFELVDLPMP